LFFKLKLYDPDTHSVEITETNENTNPFASYKISSSIQTEHSGKKFSLNEDLLGSKDC